MFTVGKHRLTINRFKISDFFNSQIGVRMFGVHYSSAIYRAPQAPGMEAVMRRRGGWRRRFKHTISNQVLFFLPITALATLAIATAMPSGLPALFSTKITATFPIFHT